MSFIIICGNPVSGHNFYGPFDTADSAAGYQDHILDEGGDWWIAPLVNPTPSERLISDSDGSQSTWEPTHYSRKDGSGAVMLTGNRLTGMITLVNENGDEWTDPADEWEPA